MPRLDVRVHTGQGRITRFFTRVLIRIAESVRDELIVQTPSKTAAKRWEIHGPWGSTVRITNRTSYLPYLIRGTGIYGPFHQVIRAKKGMYLSWNDGSGRVFARYVRGIRPTPFVRGAVETGVKAWRQKT